jgi:hypothetical protein
MRPNNNGSSPGLPVFPDFRPLDLADRKVIQDFLWAYQPETSELSFTNLFIWQAGCGYEWSLDRDWLLVVGHSPEVGAFALPPVGPAPRREVCARVLTWLAEEKKAASPGVERADRRLADELAGGSNFVAEPVRNHFDYVYRTEDLIHLAGGKYHAKRNHINTVTRNYSCRYEDLTARHLPACRELAAAWCRLKRCDDDLNLRGEWSAVEAALNHLEALVLQGGVILVNEKVEAFSLGELLNRETAVVHVEKANPEIPGLYALINQQFCERAFAGVPFINREQDLGEPGLRTAKLSYHPHRLVEKFRITGTPYLIPKT